MGDFAVFSLTFDLICSRAQLAELEPQFFFDFRKLKWKRFQTCARQIVCSWVKVQFTYFFFIVIICQNVCASIETKGRIRSQYYCITTNRQYHDSVWIKNWKWCRAFELHSLMKVEPILTLSFHSYISIHVVQGFYYIWWLLKEPFLWVKAYSSFGFLLGLLGQ